MSRPTHCVLFLLACLILIPLFVEAQRQACGECYKQITNGYAHACGLRDDGTVLCWGPNYYRECDPPVLGTGSTFAQVAGGERHTCAVSQCSSGPGVTCPANNVVCWGNNSEYQVSGKPSGIFSQVSAGEWHSCGVRSDGQIVCWGDWIASTPSPPANSVFVQVSSGEMHNCAVSECSSGCPAVNVTCWGNNGSGEATPPGTFARFKKVSAGRSHTCGLKTDGSIVCWGSDSYGQRSAPAGTYVDVAAGFNHSCGLRTDGSVSCWGLSDDNRLAVPPLRFSAISAGTETTCGVTVGGTLRCWGNDWARATHPPAGFCGLFHSDFEVGGDCRWDNGGVPCWSADCDGDGYASRDAEAFCTSIPLGTPAECPTGTWTSQIARCGTHDCNDTRSFVHSGVTEWGNGYNNYDNPLFFYDYNCDGIEEKRYTTMSSSVCCVPVSGQCALMFGLPGCNQPGWDSLQVSEVPNCGENAAFRTCLGTFPTCYEGIEQRKQTCR